MSAGIPRMVLRIVGIGLLSMLLAYITEVIGDNFATFNTPGEHLAHRIITIPPPPRELSALGPQILIAFAVDAVCYFVLLGITFAAASKYRNKS